jgi:hypothetical protein
MVISILCSTNKYFISNKFVGKARSLPWHYGPEFHSTQTLTRGKVIGVAKTVAYNSKCNSKLGKK